MSFSLSSPILLSAGFFLEFFPTEIVFLYTFYSGAKMLIVDGNSSLIEAYSSCLFMVISLPALVGTIEVRLKGLFFKECLSLSYC